MLKIAPTQPARRSGFTLIELLITIAIVAVLAVVFLFLARTQMNRARDADRKSDLEKIKIVFEDYYNDNSCYPPETILNNCEGDELQPYLDKIPCDPSTKDPYLYQPVPGAECSGYRLYAQLAATDDPAIARVGCSGPDGCGVGSGYNYGISSGVPLGGGTPPVSSPTPSSSPSPASPSPSASPTSFYACSPTAVCNLYGDPTAAGCPRTFVASNCNNQCGNSANWCTE